jgi:hypothetical protein
MAKFNLIQRVLGSLAQTKRGTESVVKFGPAADEKTTLLASHGLEGRHPRVVRLPLDADPTDAVGRTWFGTYPLCSAESPSVKPAVNACMNASALRAGRSAV